MNYTLISLILDQIQCIADQSYFEGIIDKK